MSSQCTLKVHQIRIYELKILTSTDLHIACKCWPKFTFNLLAKLCKKGQI